MGKICVSTSAIVGLAILITISNPCLAKSTLKSGESLSAGQSLEYAQYLLVMQGDCNLVLYANTVKVLWSSRTHGKGGAASCKLSMEEDGNLVIYAATTPVWNTKTSRAFAPYFLNLQGDGNVVIYGPSGAIWSTNTVQNNRKLL